MASIQSVCFLLLCSMVAITYGRVADPRGSYGYGCPGATTSEEYRMNCLETQYEEMVRSQLELEEEKDRMRVSDGAEPSRERYNQVSSCLQSAKRMTAPIILRFKNGTEININTNAGHVVEAPSH